MIVLAAPPQTRLPFPRSHPFQQRLRHSLLPLLLLLFLGSDYCLWFIFTPSAPLTPPSAGELFSGIGWAATREWLFFGRRPQPAIPQSPSSPPFPQQPSVRAKVAIIIDDLGFVQKPTEAFWDLEIPLTFAVLPWGRYSTAHAQEALNRGQEVILHLPIEPIDPQVDPGPGVLSSDYPPEELRRRLRENLSAVPGIRGVNNHMGSKGTQDRALMKLVMTELKKENLFFVDSMTIHSSIAWSVAQEYGVPTARRDVFLDGLGVELIPTQINRLIEQALTHGSAIGIAHTRPGVATALTAALPQFEAAGIELVYVSALVK